jgi:predicted metal-dependent HD superfamily phosphohydrolase
MVDIDLAILGADPYRFGIYDRAIRQEFASLSPAEFARGRALVLRSFLARPAIYQTERFRTRCEARARANLTAALAPLGQPAPIDPASPAH